jgi:four helix bundle protein
VESFDYSISKKVVTTQLIRSATSVAANYRAANRSRSDKEFISKINIVLEEADECCFWLEIIKEKNWRAVDILLKEANELTAIFVSILKKMNSKKS